MTKIRLNKTHRATITEYGQGVINKAVDCKALDAAYEALLAGANAAIRQRFPEKDMVTLRKYNLASIDRCLKFQFPSGRVDGFRFEYADEKRIADLPYRRGCGSSDVFAADEATEKAYDDLAKLRRERDEEINRRHARLSALVESAKTLDDITEVIELPADILEKLGRKSTALVALSAETLAQLADDFKLATAA
jgi:hypothetical protein